MIGKMLGHYQILEKIGQGGMGVVYLARDTLLDRKVAVKFLPDSLKEDETARKRFVREARSAAALDHPFICAIHEVGEAEGNSFIVMEYLEGQTLRDRLAQGMVPLKQAMQWTAEIAEALAEAHEKGIIHRDLKPANIMLLRTNHAKVMDFGLAKQVSAVSKSGSQEETLTALTREGTTVGTIPYMSPEQVQGKTVDLRSDLFSFGIVIYEMLTGINPFKRGSGFDTAEAILKEAPSPISKHRADAPQHLAAIIKKLLAKDPKDRYQRAREVADNLQKAMDETFGKEIAITKAAFARIGRALKKPAYLIPLILILAAGVWLGVQAWRTQWAENEVIPRAVRLAEKGNYTAALEMAQQAERIVPRSKALARLWPDISRTVSIETTPPGADIYVKDYAAVDGAWRHLGRSPLKDLRMPQGYFRLRVTKEGFAPVDGAGPAGKMHFLLDKDGTAANMVHVPASNFAANMAAFGYIGPFPLGEFRIDKFEVTNRQFKEFVDRGGYHKREYWKHAFMKNGRITSFEQAMAEFVDSTGRPGPSTWEAGTYLNGKDDFPVSGVSWYEAAAYAEFAGKSLPTLYHWYHSAQPAAVPYVVPFSNIGSEGPERVGKRGGVSPYGTYDMLGNVREWCWNEESAGRRYILGGSWNEPEYLFYWSESREPFDRAAENGFRCVKYSEPPAAALLEPRARLFRDYSKEKPVSDEAFRVIRSMYSYQHVPLDAALVSEDSSPEDWKKQKVTYSAGYGNERIIAYLFLPKRAAPPYQTLVYFPGSGTMFAQSSDNQISLERFDFLVKSGRAFLYPVYKGTYERQVGLNVGEQNREVVGQWIRDLGQSVDYLESRPDIDRQRLAYCGFSWGARLAPILLTFEERFRTALLFSGGFAFARKSLEIDEINFAPRMKTPVLMINGKYDFLFPVDTSQKPMFRLLGAPEKDKRHITIGTAHDPFIAREELIRESLDWLDRYFGPVKME